MRNNNVSISSIATMLFLITQFINAYSWSPNIPHRRLPTSLFDVPRQQIQIFENAFIPDACDAIHRLAVEHCTRTENGSSIFLRPPHNNKPLSPLEHAIDSALMSMGDTTKLVEYWSRSDHLDIETHADIDESMLEYDGVVRCPLMGHVLYLQIKEGLLGPTCVFPDETKGWNLEKKQETPLMIVPAVQGRILRFPGNAMHAVPKPHYRWLVEDQEDDDDYDDYDDEWINEKDHDSEEVDDIERSVLLFNTWPDDEPGPEGIQVDNPFDSIPDGIEIEEEDVAPLIISQETYNSVTCNPFDEWKLAEIQKKNIRVDNNGNLGMLHVPLMGRRERRFYADKVAKMIGPIETLSISLEEPRLASLILLRHFNPVGC